MNSASFTLVNAQLSDSNWLKALPKNSILSQVLNMAEEKLSDSESVTRLECDLKLEKDKSFVWNISFRCWSKTEIAKEKTADQCNRYCKASSASKWDIWLQLCCKVLNSFFLGLVWWLNIYSKWWFFYFNSSSSNTML